MIGKVEGTVAVAQRDSSKIPEYQHEAPFFVVDVPEKFSSVCDEPFHSENLTKL